jgi:hypothetical protein
VIHQLQLEGETLAESPIKADVVAEGRRIAQAALIGNSLKVGSATIVDLERGGYNSWELTDHRGRTLKMRVVPCPPTQGSS